MGRTVELRVGGQVYRVVSSASAEELHHLAAQVTAKLAQLGPRGREGTAHALLLAAIALANDLETEKESRLHFEKRTRALLQRALRTVDNVLAEGSTAEVLASEEGAKASARTSFSVGGEAAGTANTDGLPLNAAGH